MDLSHVAGKELFRQNLPLTVRCAETSTEPCVLSGDEIVVDPDLLDSLSSKDELAFLLAQKAAFRLSGQTSSGVQHGADRVAIDLMTRASFNPAAAFSALEILYRDFPTAHQGEALAVGLKAAVDGREHEGLRLSIVQVEVEKLRRAGHPSTKLQPQPLPEQARQLEAGSSSSSPAPAPLLHQLIDQAVDRLQGQPSQERLEQLLESVMKAVRDGAVAEAVLPSEVNAKVAKLLSGPTQPKQGSVIAGEFLQAVLGSNQLRELVNPLNGPWWDLFTSLVEQKGKYGLPEGMLALNALLEHAGEVPEGLPARREEVARELLRPPFKNPVETNGVLREVLRSESWAPFTEEFEKGLPAMLLDSVRFLSGQAFDQGVPEPLPAGLERRLCALLEDPKVAGPDKDAVARYLLAHWDTERSLAGKDPRRQWTRPLREYAVQHLLGHPAQSAVSASDIRDAFGLGEGSLTVLDTPTLKTLARRLENGELRPDRSSFADQTSFEIAQRAFEARQGELRPNLTFAAKAESRQVLAPLAFLGEDRAARESFTGQLTLESFQNLLGQVEEAVQRAQSLRTIAGVGKKELIGVAAGRVVLEGLLRGAASEKGLDAWYGLASRSIELCAPALEAGGLRRRLGSELWERMQDLSPEQRSRWLRREHVASLLPSSRTEEILLAELSPSPAEPVEALAEKVSRLDQEFRLRETRPALYSRLRDQVCRQARLQPATVDTVFPPDSRDRLELASQLAPQVAGLSALLAVTRQRPAAEQLATIEYLMGRQQEAPAFLEELDNQQGYLPISEIIEEVREQLNEADLGLRVLVADSFLAGPSGILRSEGGKDLLLSHFLKSVRDSDADLVQRMAGALLKAQGDTDSLALAVVFGQKSRDGQPMSQGEMLSSFFDAYGVPGVKLKQYLAFTSQFEEYKDAFGAAQDNSNPLGPYQTLKLLKDRFGERWPANLEVQGVIGSGSVNVAVRLRDRDTGQEQVVSVTRPDIEATTRHDFARFQDLLKQLTQHPEDKEKFGFIAGLLDIISDSIDLEFDKEAALKVQQMAFHTYQHQINGWNVRSIDAFRAESGGLFMELANGVSARKLKEQDPEAYESAMSAMHEAEVRVLRGLSRPGQVRPKPLFANPDFHDGQVLIDRDTKSVTILDFGQAVPISNEEREAALDLITVFGKADSARAGTRRLNERFFAKGGTPLEVSEVEAVLGREKLMGRFIHLLSLLSRHGAEVPISSVHWLLGLNRQISLAQNLEQPIEGDLKVMVGGHKFGLPLSVANTVEAVSSQVSRWTAALATSGLTALIPPL